MEICSCTNERKEDDKLKLLVGFVSVELVSIENEKEENNLVLF